ncbi:MAG: Gfo/Idh/MocA family oxidoreductase [Chloroflexi bacterium]|nr:Gfo/Idh/MocA family oxidoreductase [Chloroflexota bacterium]MCI0581094.1 Gfo/Idh/MocA family oxidoreductase [Chloroflexota bacterium]MCI0649843.1 Gfo/Idh/MocA family oxidoreductase [Chloroflexota bacterium]MCI0731348.1 Gfo/Idh/MocA family oxidoreductase [Chloroflexota bacterium]
MSAALPTYTVAVAGLGRRGLHHAEAFAANPRFRLVGLSNRTPARLEAAQEKLGEAYASTDVVEMLARTRPDVFAFCTPPQLRLPLIRAGVEAGVRLIAYEKPMATSTNEALEINELLREAGVKSVVSHQHRYGQHYQKVKEMIASGAIGRVHTVYGHATGWMLHMMTHLIEYVRWYNNYAEAEWVVGQAAGLEKFADAHPSPDYMAALIQFDNGVRGIVECGAGAPDVPEVEYWWRKCRIGAQGTEGFAEVLTGGGWRAVTRDSHGVISGPGCMDYGQDMPPYIQEIADWLDDPARVHPCNGESALKGFEIMMAACRSAVQRGKVMLPLGPGEPELEALKSVLPASSV